MFQANQQIGGYTLIKQIGRGGFGEVWLAERRTEILTTQVAIKLPHREQVNLEAIRQEAQLWAKASGHANILPIIEANIYNGQIVIVSEYAPDGSLEEKIQSPIPVKQTLETIIGILNGLDFLHSRQIIHRDIKPANILLQGETPRLADFGISRIIKTTALSTSIVGTPKYMAPEAFNGKRTVQTDIWSVGVILYQMLCGNVPFPQDNPTELMYAIVFNEPQPMPESIPPDLRKIVSKSLNKQSENRFQTAREMREEVQRALLNISHPTFAPTEVLQKKPIDNQTIIDNSIFIPKPLTDLPQPVLTEAHLIGKTVKQTEIQAKTLSNYDQMLPKIQSAESQNPAPSNPTIVQLTELTNKSKTSEEWTKAKIVRWVLYFLAPFIGTITLIFIITTYGLTIGRLVDKLSTGNTSDFDLIVVNIGFLIVGFIISFGLIGGMLGYSFPQAKWRWGLLLNIINFILLMTDVTRYLYRLKQGESTAIYALLELGSFAVVLFVPCLTSYLGSRLALRKVEPINII